MINILLLLLLLIIIMNTILIIITNNHVDNTNSNIITITIIILLFVATISYCYYRTTRRGLPCREASNMAGYSLEAAPPRGSARAIMEQSLSYDGFITYCCH